MTVKCFKSPIFLLNTIVLLHRAAKKMGVSDIHVQNSGGARTPTKPTASAPVIIITHNLRAAELNGHHSLDLILS